MQLLLRDTESTQTSLHHHLEIYSITGIWRNLILNSLGGTVSVSHGVKTSSQNEVERRELHHQGENKIMSESLFITLKAKWTKVHLHFQMVPRNKWNFAAHLMPNMELESGYNSSFHSHSVAS